MTYIFFYKLLNYFSKLNVFFQEQFLDIFLVDVTNPNETFYINDRLVEKGQAVNPSKVNNESKLESSMSIARKILNRIYENKHETFI